MSTRTTLLIGAAVALGALGASQAAQAGGDAIPPPMRHAVPAAVPVPAPSPIPDISTGWYMRIDAAYGRGDVDKYQSTTANANSVRADSYLDNYPRYGIGLGYYLNRWLRADVTVDWRNDIHSKGNGQFDYSIPNTAGGGTSPTIAMRDTFTDGFTSTNISGLANIYADLPVSHSFTPYVGAGIGFVRHQLKGRVFTRSTECIDANDCDPTLFGDDPASTILNSVSSSQAGGTDYALAAALMAGFSYKVWDNTKIDIGYRWLHLAGTSFAGRGNGIVENLKIPDQNIHEVRAGLRFEIN